MAISISLDGDETMREALRLIAFVNKVEIGVLTRAALEAYCGNQIKTAIQHNTNLEEIRKDLLINGLTGSN